MKKLTRNQLQEVKVFNPFDFAKGTPYIEYFPYGGGPMSGVSNWGWNLDIGRKRYRIRVNNAMPNGREPLADVVATAKPILEHAGLPCPDEWVRILGAYFPKDFYDKRMAELIAEYKAKSKGAA